MRHVADSLTMHPIVAKIVAAARQLQGTPAWQRAMVKRGLPPLPPKPKDER